MRINGKGNEACYMFRLMVVQLAETVMESQPVNPARRDALCKDNVYTCTVVAK